MTKLTEKDLKEILQIQRDVDKKSERLNNLREISTCTPAITMDEKVQTTVQNKSMAIADAVVDLERELDADMDRLKTAKSAADEFIKSLDLDETEQSIMHLRYVDCQYWYSISEILNYSIRHLTRKHGEILSKIF